MKLLCCSVLLLCLSGCSEMTVIIHEHGESMTLTCSSDACPSPSDSFIAFYLYHIVHGREEVLFINRATPTTPVERSKYTGRVHTEGDFRNISISISNLTVNDSGVYTCVYKKGYDQESTCSSHAVYIKAKTDNSTSSFYDHVLTEPASLLADSCPHLLLCIAISCSISVLVTALFFLVLRVKKCCRNRRTRPDRRVSSDYVYEDMRITNGIKAEGPLRSS